MDHWMLFLPFVALLSSCAKEVDAGRKAARERIAPGRIRIMDIRMNGTVARNEFGNKADRLTLYNPGSELLLEEGRWFLSDDSEGYPLKFELPELLLPAGSRIDIWCDGENVWSEEIHANFALSPKDGSVVLYYSFKGAPLAVSHILLSAQPE
ncbi:MAG: hypothetical protein KDB88_00580 [Flavobacteriales bacterium]|nr:hypothetical protein [Flavobacteriales bacterium]